LLPKIGIYKLIFVDTTSKIGDSGLKLFKIKVPKNPDTKTINKILVIDSPKYEINLYIQSITL